MAWTRIGINSLVNRRIVSSRFIHRSCSHSTLYPQIPLTQPLPDVDRPKYALTSVHKYEHQVTQLANGIKVITKPCFGQVSYIGGTISIPCFKVNITYFVVV